ncbi:hypothetical protein NDI76_06980 [Halogeometricum sp. S1BR25-6]|uniref:Secreted glycoprotein n=1 Tax=Halogeometricum salsisoli TaxID=2950536 RepID=A0ABU2GCE7_9EURY|nr:hypothetical protein [Halogeometricum sp. S1BR25-6]MDS0298480.1 hypothetical protein [Halogeometricum sp. S1BR25-6]
MRERERESACEREFASDRAVSTTLGYVLTLVITAVLVSGLLVGTGQYVDGQRDRVVDRELSVLGERIAARTADADRMVRAGDGAEAVRLRVDLPRTVAGGSYRVEVSDSPGVAGTPAAHDVTLTSGDGGRSATVRVRTGTDVENGTLAGGNLVIAYDPATERLVFESGDDAGPAFDLTPAFAFAFAPPPRAATGGAGR